ncbi:zonular occludens toxin domain-containing protein [bacterium]|nr:zonular occludens toxin domain-containing protein [bacterium]
MSIHFLTGVPRSGKTYRSVYKIWEMYRNDLKRLGLFMQWWRFFFPLVPKEVFTYTYTNINQFNFDYSPQIKPLRFDDLKSDLTVLFGLYKSGATDDVLKSKSKELGLFHSLFVIDECHNFLGTKEDDVITWWLTYHGHLHQEIHLITQQIKLVPAKYKEIAEFFYKAYPSSRQVSSKSFRYSLHASAGYFKQDSKTGIFLPFKQEVFDLYVSGKAQKRVNILKKYLFFIPILMFIVYFLYSSFTERFSEQSVIDSNSTVTKQSDNNVSHIDSNVSVPLTSFDMDNDLLIVFSCINDVCYYKDTSVPISFLKYYIQVYPPKYYDIKQNRSNYFVYTFLVDKKMISFLIPQTSKKGSSDEISINPLKSVL